MKTLKTLEYAWLFITFALLASAIYFTIIDGFQKSMLFYIFPIVGALRYYKRRKQRIELEKSVEERYKVKKT
jgi:hypothetical protein